MYLNNLKQYKHLILFYLPKLYANYFLIKGNDVAPKQNEG